MEYLKKNDFANYSNCEVNTAIDNLLSHQQSVQKFSAKPIHKANGKVFTSDFIDNRLPESNYQKCTFDGIKIHTVSFNSSHFSETSFLNCDIRDTGMQSSNFSDVEFDNCDLEGSNMSQCFLLNTTLKNSRIYGTSLLQSVIADSEIIGSEFKSVSLEACTFSNVLFKNLNFDRLNMEYSEFDRIKSDNTVYPFAQLPYIFGGLQYILNTSDSVGISSNLNGTGKITVDEYVQSLKDFIVFFWSRKEYFPLANIYSSLGQYDLAKQSIREGLFFSLQNRNFRHLKYLCKLAANIGIYTQEGLKSIYVDIESHVDLSDLSEYEYYSYCLHLPDIQRILLDNSSQYYTCHIRLNTNIDSKDIQSLSVLLEALDAPLEQIPSSQLLKRIDIRHNSDFVVTFIQSGEFQTLLLVLLLFRTVLNGLGVCGKEVGNIRSFIKGFGETKREKEMHNLKVQREKQELGQQKESHELDMKLKKQQISMNELQIQAAEDKAKEGNQKLKDSDIKIVQVSPIIYSPSQTILNNKLVQEYLKILL